MTSSTHQSTSTPSLSSHGIAQVNPLPRLLMGPGPINADPRVLRAMSAQLLGQFDPQFRGFMKQAMVMYREVFETRNEWTLIVDGTARSAIEAVMASLIETRFSSSALTQLSTSPGAPSRLNRLR